jgi:hypothetical protein
MDRLYLIGGITIFTFETPLGILIGIVITTIMIHLYNRYFSNVERKFSFYDLFRKIIKIMKSKILK